MSASVPPDFDPEALTRDASLNQLVVGSLPDRREYTGKSGADLLSRDAVVALLAELGWPEDTGAAGVSDALGAALDDDASPMHGPAEAATAEVGRRIAAVVATLRSPETAGRPEHVAGRRRYLQEWLRVDEVFLGGGLLKGPVGYRVVEVATGELAELAELGAIQRTVPLRLARHPSLLGLLGAARSLPQAGGRSLVVDCGQSSMKPGLATVEDGALARVELLPAVDVSDVSPEALLDHLSMALAGAARAAGEEALGDLVPCSIASYVRDGRPIRDDASPYDRFGPALDASGGELTVPAPTTKRVRPFRLALLHDGTCAWRGTGATGSSAVIVFGTWLGVGLGPHTAPLVPFAPSFEVR